MYGDAGSIATGAKGVQPLHVPPESVAVARSRIRPPAGMPLPEPSLPAASVTSSEVEFQPSAYEIEPPLGAAASASTVKLEVAVSPAPSWATTSWLPLGAAALPLKL